MLPDLDIAKVSKLCFENISNYIVDEQITNDIIKTFKKYLNVSVVIIST